MFVALAPDRHNDIQLNDIPLTTLGLFGTLSLTMLIKRVSGPIMLSVVMLSGAFLIVRLSAVWMNVIRLSAMMLNVVCPSVTNMSSMLSVIMMNVIIQNVVMPNVVAPPDHKAN
jgi:hypothetical protein